MFRAPGLDPGQDSRPASLIDLPRTLCDLAGLVPDERWGGRSLLEKPRSGPRFSFQTRTVQEARDAALFSQEKVLIVDALTEDTLRYAYDRLEDPLETIDRASEAPFVELRRSLDSVLRNVRQSRMKRAHAEIGLEQKINLQALGYGGDQE
ncbi:MAG TPA: hypothetical protein ENJ50_04570 [Planctomycetaceae bacterium]|nr:hypothetical protein [Planctomycetaceae bacterium]